MYSLSPISTADYDIFDLAEAMAARADQPVLPTRVGFNLFFDVEEFNLLSPSVIDDLAECDYCLDFEEPGS